MIGAFFTVAWLICARIPLGPQFLVGGMGVLLVTGGARLTYWINEAWLRFATARPLHLNQAISSLLMVLGAAMFVIGWFLFVGALLGGLLRAEEDKSPFLSGLIAGLCVFCLYGGALAMNAAKRSNHARRCLQARVEDAKGQVVFLRAFAADASPAAQEGVLRSFAMRTEEELLAQAVQG